MATEISGSHFCSSTVLLNCMHTLLDNISYSLHVSHIDVLFLVVALCTNASQAPQKTMESCTCPSGYQFEYANLALATIWISL